MAILQHGRRSIIISFVVDLNEIKYNGGFQMLIAIIITDISFKLDARMWVKLSIQSNLVFG